MYQGTISPTTLATKTAPPQVLDREILLQLKEYRVVTLKYDRGPNEYIVERAEVDALGAQSWRYMAKISESFQGGVIDDFLFVLFNDIHEDRRRPSP